jgi:hypothetical protein
VSQLHRMASAFASIQQQLLMAQQQGIELQQALAELQMYRQQWPELQSTRSKYQQLTNALAEPSYSVRPERLAPDIMQNITSARTSQRMSEPMEILSSESEQPSAGLVSERPSRQLIAALNSRLPSLQETPVPSSRRTTARTRRTRGQRRGSQGLWGSASLVSEVGNVGQSRKSTRASNYEAEGSIVGGRFVPATTRSSSWHSSSGPSLPDDVQSLVSSLRAAWS